MTVVEKAIEFAKRAHAGQKRKGTEREYIQHPLEAMRIVAGLTDDEEIIAAAVLHDTLEDTSTKKAELVTQFGQRVADLVAAESENKRENLPAEGTWKTRKNETIRHLRTLGRDAKLICLGDKLSNLRELSQDYSAVGEKLWQRFNQKDKAMHCWYYASIYQILRSEFGDMPEIREYSRRLYDLFGWKGEQNG